MVCSLERKKKEEKKERENVFGTFHGLVFVREIQGTLFVNYLRNSFHLRNVCAARLFAYYSYYRGLL